MKKYSIVKIIWTIAGFLFIGLIVFSTLQVYVITEDIRRVTSQLKIEDVRKVLDIIELIEKNKLEEIK